MISAGEFRNKIGQVRQVRRGAVTVAIVIMGREAEIDLPIGWIERLAGQAAGS
jgi:transcription antitermination factor NusG